MTILNYDKKQQAKTDLAPCLWVIFCIVTDIIIRCAHTIDKNAAVNGLFLPYIRNKYVTTESMHTGNHLGSYYKAIEDRFKDLSERINEQNLGNDEAVKEICLVLENIRKDLLNGKLKTNNS